MQSSSQRPADPAHLPTGVVSFLMSDVEGSTRVWRERVDAGALLSRQAELLGAAVARHAGIRPPDQGEGDSLLAVFVSPTDALAAALEAQLALAAEAWPEGGALRVRMAIHTGEAVLREGGNYGGAALIRCARLRALARGEQVLVSNATAELTRESLPEGAALAPLGEFALAGFEQAERVHQLCHPALPGGLAAPRRARAALPPWPTPLIGRERELAELEQLLASERLVTLTGAGGSGKTRLAHAVGERLGERFADGVALVELARIGSGAEVPSAVASACGVAELAGVPVAELLVRALAGRELLLVLDNCEHVLGGCAALAEALLYAAPALRVLATSREPLGAAGETSWRVPSLAVPGDGERDLSRIGACGAVALFVARARAARNDFALDAETAPPVARICRRLDGIPLALELAAARVRSLSVERLADGLDDRFRLLTGGARTALARQRTLLASVEWSHELLDDEERRLFRRLGVFAGPFDLEAAEAVATDAELDRFRVLDVLSRLVDKSLVLHEGDRYRLLETLRQYAQGRADDVDELEVLRDRHLAWFVRRVEGWQLERELPTASVLNAIAAVRADLTAALEWSLGQDHAATLCLLHARAEDCWRHIAVEETRRLGAAALASAPEGSLAWLELLARIALPLFFSGEAGWLPAARAGLERERARLGALERALLEHATSMGLAWLGVPEGVAGLRRAIESAREAGSRAVELSAAAAIAMTSAMLGDVASARQLLDWLDRHLPPDAELAFDATVTRALAATYDGDFATARRLIEAALANQLLEHDMGAATTASLIGFWTGDLALVEASLTRLEAHPPFGAFDGMVAWVRAERALLAGDSATALRELSLESSAEALGNLALWQDYNRAELELAEGDPAAARARLTRLAPRIDGSELHYVCACVELLRAELERIAGEPAAAEALAHAALARAVERGMGLVACAALEGLALIAADAGSEASAGRLLGAAEAFRGRTGFSWRYPAERAALEALRPRLDPAALAEGAALSLADAAAWARRGRGERGRPSRGWSSLSPTEQRVVELVAEGLANKEIAARLFVSVATVKTHLQHVYAKVGVRSRAELAAAAVRRGS